MSADGQPTSSFLPLRPTTAQRAADVDDLLTAVKQLVVSFVESADEDAATKSRGHGLQQAGQGPRTALVEHHAANKLQKLLDWTLPTNGRGRDGFLSAVKDVLQYSVNTWDQGFLDKLYSATTPVGLASDLLLSALNSNVHVYHVSPALTVVEKETTRALAQLFGLAGPHAGGVTHPGGSAANLSSLVIARNHRFPATKTEGLRGITEKPVLFTSQHGHYSVEKASQILGFGTSALRSVAVDDTGAMRADALEEAIEAAIEAGETPFYVNATAGTTVYGAYDPLTAIAEVCAKHKLWFHVDASWGGSVVFSERLRKAKLAGIEHADSITWCAHKMLNIGLPCSFLLGRDLRIFKEGMTLRAGYLFHDDEEHNKASNGEIWDLADLTPQCGRRGDSLKLALSWVYEGTEGFSARIEAAVATAEQFSQSIKQNSRFTLVTPHPPPCLQVAFYFELRRGDAKHNTRITSEVSRLLVPRGFMVDYAPGDDGMFFRVVVNTQTRQGTLDGLVIAIEEVGQSVLEKVNKN